MRDLDGATYLTHFLVRFHAVIPLFQIVIPYEGKGWVRILAGKRADTSFHADEQVAKEGQIVNLEVNWQDVIIRYIE